MDSQSAGCVKEQSLSLFVMPYHQPMAKAKAPAPAGDTILFHLTFSTESLA